MEAKVNTRVRIRQWRLWLAQQIAPAGADVHDPDETACPGLELLLSGIFFGQILTHGDRLYLDVTDDVDDLATMTVLVAGQRPSYDNVIHKDVDGWWSLTDAGEQELGRMWTTDRMPPWSRISLGECDSHGDYDSFPGDLIGCAKCRLERARQAP